MLKKSKNYTEVTYLLSKTELISAVTHWMEAEEKSFLQGQRQKIELVVMGDDTDVEHIGDPTHFLKVTTRYKGSDE